MNSYVNFLIMEVAAKVIGDKASQDNITSFLEKEEIEKAKESVLKAVDSRYWDWQISFTDATEFYNLLGPSPKRASEFLQRQNRAFF